MKIKLLKILILLFIVLGLGITFKDDIFHAQTNVKAFGDLIVNFHDDPLFTFSNIAPGDDFENIIDINNAGDVSHDISVKAVRKNGVGDNDTHHLEEALAVTIKENDIPVYGPVSLLQFFSDSTNNINGIPLGTIAAHTQTPKQYKMDAEFPKDSGNDYQETSVAFDLVFGTEITDRLIISEVYYEVDPAHGLDSPKDRGILNLNGNNVTINISNTGTGSTNTVNVNQSQACSIIQSDNTTVNNGVIIVNNTGGNTNSGNTGGSSTIITGNSTANIKITTTGSVNSAGCGQKLGQNDEWIEIYNPTDHDISLKNWSITDNSGTKTKISANQKIKKGGYVLLAKSSSTWKTWNLPKKTPAIQLGSQIGDGLDNAGDRLLLNNPDGTTIDAISWGTDSTIFDPSVTGVTNTANSLQLINPNLILSSSANWHEYTPTPGK